jgi:hypothetical protein
LFLFLLGHFFWLCQLLGNSFKGSLYMFDFQKSQAQSCMLLVKCYCRIKICVDYIVEDLCVIESGPDYEF